jgi:hypothetical protein
MAGTWDPTTQTYGIRVDYRGQERTIEFGGTGVQSLIDDASSFDTEVVLLTIIKKLAKNIPAVRQAFVDKGVTVKVDGEQVVG